MKLTKENYKQKEIDVGIRNVNRSNKSKALANASSGINSEELFYPKWHRKVACKFIIDKLLSEAKCYLASLCPESLLMFWPRQHFLPVYKKTKQQQQQKY